MAWKHENMSGVDARRRVARKSVTKEWEFLVKAGGGSVRASVEREHGGKAWVGGWERKVRDGDMNLQREAGAQQGSDSERKQNSKSLENTNDRRET